LECWPYADELASGDKDKKTLGSACSVEVIAYLPTIKLYLLDIRINVRFPVDNQIDRAVRLTGKRIDNTADVNRAIGIGVGRKDRHFGNKPAPNGMKETTPQANLPLSLATWSAKAFLIASHLRNASQLRPVWSCLSAGGRWIRKRSPLQANDRGGRRF
jgi:hypothetical protein